MCKCIRQVLVNFCLCLQKTCQTVPVHTAEAEAQVRSVLTNSTQTDPSESPTDQLTLHLDLSDDPPGLRDFLQRVEDLVIQELVKNSKSHAFDGYEVNWTDQHETVRLRHKGEAQSPMCVMFSVLTLLYMSCTGLMFVQSRVL